MILIDVGCTLTRGSRQGWRCGGHGGMYLRVVVGRLRWSYGLMVGLIAIVKVMHSVVLAVCCEMKRRCVGHGVNGTCRFTSGVVVLCKHASNLGEQVGKGVD